MIRGMTGYGTARVSYGKIKGVVEIKSQNHRYADIVFYLPNGFSSVEKALKDLLSAEVQRGRVIVSFKITDKPLGHVNFNEEAVREYLKYAKVVKSKFGLQNNLQLADLIRLPGVVETKEIQVEAEEIWPAVQKGIRAALSSLVRMRKSEGRCLAADGTSLLKRMTMQLKKIQARSRAILSGKKKILTNEEFSSTQKSLDISEELTRLQHYIVEYKALLKSNTSVGKKLDFVAQEMQRETNTIGSKLQDKVVSNAVIALKSKIEKLREQAQNIE